MPRIRARRIFLEADRIPRIQFYTSNLPKFLQARLAFELAGLTLWHFKGHTEPYEEDYSRGKDELLRLAVEQVRRIADRDSIFFVEDTSLRIEALSRNGEDFPGLRVKEWYQATTFDELDAQLSELGVGREATIKSDIALSLPGLDRPLYFRGESVGRIAPTPSQEPTSARYPWLSSDSFSGWFIPDQSSRRLSEMDFESSQNYDFRIAALSGVLDRLEEYMAVTTVRSVRRVKATGSEAQFQPSLFAEHHSLPVLVVIGATCAGKTTLAEYAFLDSDLRHVEASGVLRMFKSQGEAATGAEALSDAKDFLAKMGDDFVARQIIRLYGEPQDRGLVITGFRTIGELNRIVQHWPHARVVYVQADERIRFERHLKRERYQDAPTIADFRTLDHGQRSLGLLNHGMTLCDATVTNEESLETFRDAIQGLLTETPHRLVRTHPLYVKRMRSKLYRVLSILKAGESLTSRQISDRLTGQGDAMATRNVNWVLSHARELADRYESPGEQIHYRISAHGQDYVNYIDQRAAKERAE